MNKNYEDAISFYSKAIENAEEGDEDMHIYYSNSKSTVSIDCFNIGATSHYLLKKFDESLEDAKICLDLKPDFVKGLIRLASAQRELLMNEEALETLNKAIELDDSNETAVKLYEECKQEWDDDHTVSEDDVEKKKFNRLEKWLKDGNSVYDKLKIRFYTPIYRGVHASRDIVVSSFRI